MTGRGLPDKNRVLSDNSICPALALLTQTAA
jgi:hypothetical protein